MKTVLDVTGSGKNSGYAEALTVESGLNTRPLAEEIWLADACTPIPNCRPAEILLSIWAALHTSASTTIHTDVISAGVHLGSPEDVNPAMLTEWVELFDQRLHRERLEQFLQYAPAGLVVKNVDVCNRRLEKIRLVAEILRPSLGDVETHRVKVTDGAFCFDVPISQTKELLRDRASLGVFVCPGCSYQAKQPMTHAVRFMSGALAVTQPASVAAVKCPASRVFLAKAKSLDFTIGHLIRVIGFRPSGKLFYALSRTEDTISRGMCMRDYSDPRGSVESAWRLWSPNIWMSTRLYVVDQNKMDLSFDQFVESLQHNTGLFASAMRGNSFLSRGEVFSFVSHIGGA